MSHQPDPASSDRVSASLRTPKHEGPDATYKWWVLVTVVFGAFASILDSTIVNTALPRIQRVFGADLHVASYVATAYILAAGVVVPASGFLANRFGIKRIYLASLSFFTLGSVLCGAAPNMLTLIAFRVLQGAGGAALFPLSFALLFAAFPQEERGKANGLFGIPVLVAPAIGPTLGGYLTEYVDWRWIFYVNLPVGILGVLLGLRCLRRAPPRPELRFDLPGFLLAGCGLGLLLFGLSNLAYDGLGDVRMVSGPIIAAVVLLTIFIPFELRRRQPLLNLWLYCRRNFALGNVIAWLATVGLFVPAFLLPQYLQTLRGLSPFAAGLLLLWQGLGAIGGTILSGQVYNRVGPRPLIVAGALIAALTGYWLGQWVSTIAALSVLPWILFPRGVGLPIALQPTNTTALDGITGSTLPEATTLNVVARNVVGSLSIAVLTNVLQQRAMYYVSRAGHAPRAIFDARALAYHDVFLITAAIIVPAIVLALFLRPSPGRPAVPAGRREDEEAPCDYLERVRQEGRAAAR
jgi:MFS transporter, DHA2 family, multidrug resistance protein